MTAPTVVQVWLLAALVLAGTLATACERRAGERQLPAAGSRPEHVPQLDLVAGTRAMRTAIENPYQDDAPSLQEGKRLYGWFNCGGCHFEGGGGIGPAFMDGDWVYGGAPGQIFDSIVSGRANGMPVFGDKLTVEQTWHLVGYVQSLEQSEDEGGQKAGERGRAQ